MPTRAPVISRIDLRVASSGLRPSSLMIRSTFSTTTMASSTSSPMASTRANMVSTLMENPTADRMPNVPKSTTGTAMVGIRVARQFCRNRKITRKTRMMASARVFTTSPMDFWMNGVVSMTATYLTPGGKVLASSAMRALTALAVSSALAPGVSRIGMPAAGLPLNLTTVE